MYCQRPDSGILCYPCNGFTIAVTAIPAGTDLQGNRQIDCGNSSLQNILNQLFIFQQSRTCCFVADFFSRASHIDIDDICTVCSGKPGGLCHHFRITTGDLNYMQGFFRIFLQPMAGFSGIPEFSVGSNHLGNHHACPQSSAQLSERHVGYTGHRCQDYLTVNGVLSDLKHDQPQNLKKSIPWKSFRSLSGTAVWKADNDTLLAGGGQGLFDGFLTTISLAK